MSATRRACAAAAAVVALALAIPPLTGQFYYGLDLTRIDLALLCAIQERLGQPGSLALSPLLGHGGPLLARPDAQLFYLPRWVALAFPPDWGIAFEVIFHLSAAAAATAWLARTFAIRPFTAAAVGIAFALSGTVIDLLRHAHYMVGAAWLPLVWAGTRRALRRPGERLPLLAVFGGLLGCLLGAEPQSFVVALVVIGLEAAFALFRHRALAARALALAGTAVAAGLVGMLQWAPTFGELALTRRGGNLGAEALDWSLSPPSWLGIVLPGTPMQYVQPVTNLLQVLDGSLRAAAPWNFSPYLGSLVVVGAVVGLSIRRARAPAVVALGASIFALGVHLPVLPFAMKVFPALTRFRYPAKYWLIATLALLIVAAIAIDGLTAKRHWRRRTVLGAAAMAAALGVGLGWVVRNDVAIDQLAAQMRATPVGMYLPTLSGALRGSLLHALVPIGLALVLLATPRLRRYLFGLVVFDMIAALPYALLIGPGLAAPGPARPALPARAVACVDPALSGRFFPFTHERLEWNQTLFMRVHQLPELHACSGVSAGYVYSPLESSLSSSLQQGLRDASGSAVRAFGCTHFLAERPFLPDVPVNLQPIEFELPDFLDEPTTRANTWLFELPAPIPEVFVAREASFQPDEASALSQIAVARGLGAVLRIVDDPLRRLGSAPVPDGNGITHLQVEWPEPETATVRLTGHGGAVVGLRTPFLAGWTATQAGRPLPTVRVSGTQLGAVVADASAGPVEYRYRVPNLWAGFAAAACGVLCLGFVMVSGNRGARRSRPKR